MKKQRRFLSLFMTIAMVVSMFAGYAANLKVAFADADATIRWHFQNSKDWELCGAWLYEGSGWTTNRSPVDKCVIFTKEEDPETGDTNYKQVWPGAAMEKEEGHEGWVTVEATYDTAEVLTNGMVQIFNNYVADNWTNDTTTVADLDNIKANAIDGKVKINALTGEEDQEVLDYWSDAPESIFDTKQQTANITITKKALVSASATDLPTDIYAEYDTETDDIILTMAYANGAVKKVNGNKTADAEIPESYADAPAPVTEYAITQDLTNVTSTNGVAKVEENEAFETTLAAADETYTINAVTVTMNGEDITETAYNAETGVVSIEAVTGDVVITASAEGEPVVPEDIADIVEEGQTIYSIGSAMAPQAWAPEKIVNAMEEVEGFPGVYKIDINVPAEKEAIIDDNGDVVYSDAGEWTYRFGICATTVDTTNVWNRVLVGTTTAPEVTDNTSNCLSNIRPRLEDKAYTATVYFDSTTGAVAIYKADEDISSESRVPYTLSWVGNDNDEPYIAPEAYSDFATVGDYEATLSTADRATDLEKCGFNEDSDLPDFDSLLNTLYGKLEGTNGNVSDIVEEGETLYTLGSAMAPVAWNPDARENLFQPTKWDGVVKANISVPADGANEWEYRFGIIATTVDTTNVWNRILVGTTVAPEVTDTTSNCLTNIRPALEAEAYTATVYLDTTTGAVMIYKNEDDNADLKSCPSEPVAYTMSWVGYDNQEAYIAPEDYADFATVGDYEDILIAEGGRTADLEKCGFTADSDLPDFQTLNDELNTKLTRFNVADVVEEGETIYTIGSAMSEVPWAPQDSANMFEETKWDGVVKYTIHVPAEGANEWEYRFGIIATTADTTNAWNRMLVGTTVAPETTDTTSNCLTNIRPALEADAYDATVYLDTTTGAVMIYKNADETLDGNSSPSEPVAYTMSWVGNDNDEAYIAPADYADFATVGDYEDTLNAKDDRTADLEKCGFEADSELPDFVALNEDLDAKLTTLKVSDLVGDEETIYTIGSAMSDVAWNPDNIFNKMEETKWDDVVKYTIHVPAEGANEWEYRFGICATTADTTNAWNRILVGTDVAPETTDKTSNCLTNIRPQLEAEAYDATVYLDTKTGAVVIFKVADDGSELSTPDGFVDYTMSWVGNDNDEPYYSLDEYKEFATVGDYEATLSTVDRVADLEKCGFNADSVLPDFEGLRTDLAKKLVRLNVADIVKEGETIYTIGSAMATDAWDPSSSLNAMVPTKWPNVYKYTVRVPAASYDDGSVTGDWAHRFGIIATTVDTTQNWNRLLLGTDVLPEVTDTTSCCLSNIRLPLEELEYDATIYFDASTGAVMVYKNADDDNVAYTIPSKPVEYTLSWVGNDDNEPYFTASEYDMFDTVAEYTATLGEAADRSADLEKCGYTEEKLVPDFAYLNKELALKLQNKEASAELTVEDIEETIGKDSIGATVQSKAKVTVNGVEFKDSIAYSSSDDSVASVDSLGTITLNGYGVATITAVAANGALSKEFTVTVNRDIIPASIAYRVQVQKTGWEKSFVKDGKTSGTVGKALRLEAIQIKLLDEEGNELSKDFGGVEYRTHVQKNGWEKSYAANGATSGTVGKALRLEAIQIRLTGAIAEQYDVYYRVQAEKFGWLGWAKNDEEAGTAGYAYRLEAIQIQLVEKEGEAPESGSKAAFYDKKAIPTVAYKTQVQTFGWEKKYATNGATSGTVGKAKRLEAIRIKISNAKGYEGAIQYRTHVQKQGWQKFVSNDALSGTVGKALRLEAIQIKLTGELADNFDVYYRVQAQKFGWMGWAKNGASAGTSGFGYRLEAIQIQLVYKNTVAPGSTANAYRKK